MSEMNEKIDRFMEDLDQDGTPDSIQRALQDVKTQLSQKMTIGQKTFTKKNFYLSIVIGLIVAGYGLFGFMYMSLRDDKIAIENQFNWFKSEQEIEINKAVMEERRRKINELYKKYGALSDDLDKKRDLVDTHMELIVDKPFAEEIKNEVQNMDTNDLRKSFSDLGYPSK